MKAYLMHNKYDNYKFTYLYRYRYDRYLVVALCMATMTGYKLPASTCTWYHGPEYRYCLYSVCIIICRQMVNGFCTFTTYRYMHVPNTYISVLYLVFRKGIQAVYIIVDSISFHPSRLGMLGTIELCPSIEQWHQLYPQEVHREDNVQH